MPKNNSSINNSLFDLLKGKGYSPTMLSTAGKEIPTPDEAEVFQFNFVKDGEDYGKVTLSIDDASNLIVYYSDDVADSEKEASGSGDLSWYGLLNQLKRFAQRYQLSFELRNTDNLKSDMAKRDYMKKQDQIAESKHQRMAEGAPELLKKEMPLHRHAEKLLAQNGVSKDDPDYHHHLNNTIKHLRQFGNIDLINKIKEQGMAEGQETMKQVSEGYYPMGKQGSYSDAVPTTKIVIQHSRRIEEGEQRYRNIAKIFVENSDGERFAVPTNKPGLARVYARHIAEGGTPYDERGRHITSLVEEYSKMSGFMRATRGKQFNESAQQLVTEAVNYYQSLRESLSKMTGHRGYAAYFESWTPALMEDGEEQETNLNELFVQETLDPRIESVMPILSKLQRKLGTIKEVDELAEWADNIIEGDGGQEALNPIGIPEATDVTDDNPKSQGGTRAELLRKYANTKRSKDAEAARRAGASQSELKTAADSTEEIHEGASSQDLQNAILYRVEMRHPDLVSKYGHEYVADKALDVASFYAGAEEIGSSDISAMVNHLVDTLKREGENGLDENLDADQKRVGQLGPTEKVGPKGAVGKLVGANESVNESEDELARILQMVKHKR